MPAQLLFGKACYASWQGGDFAGEAPQGNQPFCQAMHDPQCQHRGHVAHPEPWPNDDRLVAGTIIKPTLSLQ